MTEPAQERIKSLEQRLAKEPQSPLFARLADYYLQLGRANDALRLCDDGLALYPHYATAHLIKAKVLVQLGMMAEARHAYEVVREFLPTNESVVSLTSIIDRLPAQDHGVVEAVEEPVGTEPTQASPQEHAYEEVVVEENQPAAIAEPQAAPAEEPSQQEPAGEVEEPPAQEFGAEQPQPVETAEPLPATDDSFGFGEQPVAEPQPEEPSAGEKLGLDMQPEPQQPEADFGFGAPAAEQPAAAVEETPFGSQPIEEPRQAAEPEPEQRTEPSPGEAPAIQAAPAAPEAAAEQPADWFEAFSQLQQPAAEAAEPPAPQEAEEENPFAMFGAEQTSSTVEGEPYEEFTARVRMDLFGTEDTMTLEEYLSQTGSAGPPAAPDNIGELAEKLKTSQRITPPVINFSEKAARTAGEADAAGGSGFVTPTLAEIYVKQGWFDDAIKAYRALAANKPAEKEKFEQRIAEIEELKKKP